jgi:hypothetical protein
VPDDETKLRASAYVAATYPILDRREREQIEAQRLSDESAAIDAIANYCDLSASIESLKRDRMIALLKESRAKVRQHSGVINLDDRVANLEKIAEIDKLLRSARSKRQSAIEKLKIYIAIDARSEVEKMIKDDDNFLNSVAPILRDFAE